MVEAVLIFPQENLGIEFSLAFLKKNVKNFSSEDANIF